jgi:hypothetical protein
MLTEDGPARGIPAGVLDARVDLSGWPGAHRRQPILAHPACLTLRPLAQALARAIARDVAPAGSDHFLLTARQAADPLEVPGG